MAPHVLHKAVTASVLRAAHCSTSQRVVAIALAAILGREHNTPGRRWTEVLLTPGHDLLQISQGHHVHSSVTMCTTCC